jgi:hypothetical protein
MKQVKPGAGFGLWHLDEGIEMAPAPSNIRAARCRRRRFTFDGTKIEPRRNGRSGRQSDGRAIAPA